MADDVSYLAPALIPSAAGIYLTGEDNLRLTTWGALAGAIVTVEGRIVTPGNRLVPFVDTDVPNSDRTAHQKTVILSEGLLTNVACRVSTGAALRGTIFAVLELLRGRDGAAISIGTLLSDYVTTNGRLAWPGSPIRASVEGPGRLRSITGTDPAAGVEISETVPTGARWQLHALVAAYVADATVANREPELVFDDGATIYARSKLGANITAGQTIRAAFNLNGFTTAGGAATTIMSIVPNLALLAGHRIRTVTQGIVAGDNWGAPQLLVEEWIDP